MSKSTQPNRIRPQTQAIEITPEHEEIITHSEVEPAGKTFIGEARIMGSASINGKQYSFNEVVRVRFYPT